MTTEIVRYIPTPKQREFHMAFDQFDTVGFISGVNAGKTTAGFCEAMRRASLQKCDGMIVAPNDGMFTKVIAPIIRKWLPRQWIADENQTKKFIRLVNGSTIWWASGHNPLDLEGTSLQWCWLDEAKNYPNADVYNIMSARIGRDNRGGKLWITTTPIGLHHWLYDVFVANRHPHVTYIKANTADNIYAPAEYLNRLKTMYTGVYARQQLDGDFVSFEGLVYDTFSLEENVAPVERNPNNPLYIGIDDGYAHGGGVGTPSYHPRVILFVERQPNGAFHVLDEYIATNELPEVSLANAFTMYPKHEIYGAYIDSSASDLIRRVGDLGVSYMRATHRVADGIKVMRRAILDGNGERLLKINPRCKHLIREFQTYRYSDNMRSEAGELAPIKSDDHSLDACRYVIYHQMRWD